MNDWKIGLDKYLTTEPDNNYTDWCELVCEKFNDVFYSENEDWITDSELCNRWMGLLFDKKYYSEKFSVQDMAVHSAKIIERSFKLYKIKQ